MCYQHEAQLVQSAMAPADARRIVQRMCDELHVEDLTDTAALLTSELVTNAVQHARGPLQLGVACTHGRLVVSVKDADPVPPQPRHARSRELGGRGLVLVDKLAEHWGFTKLPNEGKAVWFALRPRKPPVPTKACNCSTETLGSALMAERTGESRATPSIPASRKAD